MTDVVPPPSTSPVRTGAPFLLKLACAFGAASHFSLFVLGVRAALAHTAPVAPAVLWVHALAMLVSVGAFVLAWRMRRVGVLLYILCVAAVNIAWGSAGLWSAQYVALPSLLTLVLLTSLHRMR